MMESLLDDSRPNLLITTQAGKSVFVRYGDYGAASRLCSLLQVIGSSVSDVCGSQMQSLQSDSIQIVFMHVNQLLLAAFGRRNTVAYLKLQLEYAYTNLLTTLTSHIQTTLLKNPSFDVQSVFTQPKQLRELLVDMQVGRPASFFTGGVESIILSARARDAASRVVRSVARTPFPNTQTIFAMILAGSQLLTIVLSAYEPHQLRVSDFSCLVQHCLRKHTQDDEWFPFCFPRFNSTGFLYCYNHQLFGTDTRLVLVSQNHTDEQLKAFHWMKDEIRRQLHVPQAPANQAMLSASSDCTVHHTDEHQSSSEEKDADDWVELDASSDASGKDYSVCFCLWNEIEAATNKRNSLVNEYLRLVAGALHFCFRLNVPIRHSKSNATVGLLVQCVSSQTTNEEVWETYQKLNLRLRLGSASTESVMDAFGGIVKDMKHEKSRIGKDCPAMSLFESLPHVESVCYVIQGGQTYLAMNEGVYELYVLVRCMLNCNYSTHKLTILLFDSYVTVCGHDVKQIMAQCAGLAQQLIMEQHNLFLSHPLTWKE
jgi:hypothetical protein